MLPNVRTFWTLFRGGGNADFAFQPVSDGGAGGHDGGADGPVLIVMVPGGRRESRYVLDAVHDRGGGHCHCH